RLLDDGWVRGGRGEGGVRSCARGDVRTGSLGTRSLPHHYPWKRWFRQWRSEVQGRKDCWLLRRVPVQQPCEGRENQGDDLVRHRDKRRALSSSGVRWSIVTARRRFSLEPGGAPEPWASPEPMAVAPRARTR